jgi:uncharacterized cupredoxin-like copper-binding protein
MKKAAALALLLLASIALVACGSGGESSSSSTGAETGGSSETAAGGGGAAAGSVVKVATPTNGNLTYTSKHATAKAGQVSIEFTNPQELEHDVAIENSSGEVVGKTELVASGSATTTVNLKPGTYKFFCTVPGHREAGMEGTLTVK